MKTRAVFVDFGGVLTTSVFEGFRAFARSIGVAPELPFRLLVSDPLVHSAFIEFETGRLTDEHFETVMATALTQHGGTVEAMGLLQRMRSGIRPDIAMIELIAGVKAAGHPVALVSNSLGRGCYDGVDLRALVDVAIVSAEVGLRKPSRAMYQLACRKLGVDPANVVMIDDLPHNIDGARRAGIDGIVHGDAATTAEELATRFGVFPQLPPTPNQHKTIWRRHRPTHWMR
ncbi:HAD family hydrolase [Nocardia abscessus]|uniref:HAD family hydrolase n=1 Tax=Nocardia abscessus TaxID=120957 RepID=UPI0024590958|nr:HAD family phosphatase [Nocardia abscessus]